VALKSRLPARPRAPFAAVEQSTSAGSITIPNRPQQSVTVSVTTEDNQVGFAYLLPGQSSADIELRGIGSPSTVDNNDFSLLAEGWETAEAPYVSIGEHVEDIPVLPTASAGAKAATAGSRAARDKAAGPSPPSPG